MQCTTFNALKEILSAYEMGKSSLIYSKMYLGFLFCLISSFWLLFYLVLQLIRVSSNYLCGKRALEIITLSRTFEKHSQRKCTVSVMYLCFETWSRLHILGIFKLLFSAKNITSASSSGKGGSFSMILLSSTTSSMLVLNSTSSSSSGYASMNSAGSGRLMPNFSRKYLLNSYSRLCFDSPTMQNPWIILWRLFLYSLLVQNVASFELITQYRADIA